MDDPASATLTLGRLARSDAEPGASSAGILIGQGSEAQVFALDADSVFRVSRRGSGPDDWAFKAHVTAWDRGAPVPRPHGPANIGGHYGLVMERLEPSHLLHSMSTAPWSVMAAGRIMGTVHAAIHDVTAPAMLPTAHEVVLSHIACRQLPRSARQILGELMRTLPTGNRLLHGDFNPANLLRRPASGEWLAVDWSGAVRGNSAADVAITLVTIACGAIPESAPRWACAAAPAGRWAFSRAYLNAYRARRSLDLKAVRRWASVWRILRGATLDVNREVTCVPLRKARGGTMSPARPEPVEFPPTAECSCGSSGSYHPGWPWAWSVHGSAIHVEPPWRENC
ncbi:phosphotransferase family protein [Streptomyces sp. bgisy159]|uniref:phosphotransferase family protein n=1 Tax=Streptomyces sp. bgisy159 TaxID=3413795 RepID=UPI003F49BCC1